MFLNACAYCGSKGSERMHVPLITLSKDSTQSQVCSFNLTHSIYSTDWKLAQLMFVYSYPLDFDIYADLYTNCFFSK